MSTTKSKAQLAAEAGERGKKTAPLTREQRISNYSHHNWVRSGHRFNDLTLRQWRRIDRMSDRDFMRANFTRAKGEIT